MSSERTPKRRGLVLIVSSPSGAGKTTLTRALLDKDNSLHLSVSVTTRPRRANEVNGVHYHFLKSVREFEMRREAGELLDTYISNIYFSKHEFTGSRAPRRRGGSLP